MNLKSLLLCLALFPAVALFAGCGGKEPGVADGPEPPAEEQELTEEQEAAEREYVEGQ